MADTTREASGRDRVRVVLAVLGTQAAQQAYAYLSPRLARVIARALVRSAELAEEQAATQAPS